MQKLSSAFSIALDGSDQSAFGLPDFTGLTRDVLGPSMKAHLSGVFQHRAIKHKLSVLRLTEELDQGGSHVMEAFHLYLISRQSRDTLPQKFYVHMENYTRENENGISLDTWIFWCAGNFLIRCLCLSFPSVKPTETSVKRFCEPRATSEQTMQLSGLNCTMIFVRPTMSLQQSQQ